MRIEIGTFEDSIEIDHSIEPGDCYYTNMQNGIRIRPEKAEALNITEHSPYTDPNNKALTKRIVFEYDGLKLIALCHRPHFHVSLHPYGDKPLPKHLQDIGVFSNYDLLKAHLLQLKAKRDSK